MKKRIDLQSEKASLGTRKRGKNYTHERKRKKEKLYLIEKIKRVKQEDSTLHCCKLSFIVLCHIALIGQRNKKSLSQNNFAILNRIQ